MKLKLVKKFFIIKFICLFFISCSSFVKDEENKILKQFEVPVYILQKDVTIRQHVIPKNAKVKLFILSGDWIKVYGYRYEDDILQQKRMLLLYLFQDDFPNEKFDVDFFQEKLYEVVKPVTENTKGR
jgi:type II secretion system-associated lipoprotein